MDFLYPNNIRSIVLIEQLYFIHNVNYTKKNWNIPKKKRGVVF